MQRRPPERVVFCEEVLGRVVFVKVTGLAHSVNAHRFYARGPTCKWRAGRFRTALMIVND